ncbi:CDP-diacylglycerol--glycerol-3-phosphate 3-phosphatidyltransferase [Lawsonibacter celer]|uniref:CDP-diacylglycerol--glycerol-3-phosphate 3-phosphatidyltransferase n=1 Tax=Lawsonibacter celer TaxID=2986526 RepID=UPI001646E05C|nr:CDP-diacylglycerol--glycerol-3-phosphate 3-phosphatidyltransferase [Lawsonibacter celer]
MNTANKLTLLRVILIPVFLVVLYLDFPFHMFIALMIFILASVTDFLDGYIARHYNQVTDFGKFMDPLADKVLVMAAMCWFVATARMPAWALVIVLFREFAVTALRLIAAERGRVIAAAWSGKVKTASTMVCICLMLLFRSWQLDAVCVAVIVVTTIYSGIEYFLKNRDVMDWKNM